MAPRTSRSRPRRRKPTTPIARNQGLLGRGRRGRITGLGLALVLAGWFLGVDFAAWLPDPAATVVREAESWVEATLRDLNEALPTGTDAPSRGGRPQGEPLDAGSARQALDLLDRVRVEDERPRGYDRDAWPHWLDEDGDCMNTRHEVLVTESLERPKLSRDGCNVVSGLWRDAYTGEALRDPSDLDIDHVVPLAEAYRSGGRNWSAERRAAFANDLEDARTLIAVRGAVNRAKGDKDPTDWLPPSEAALCGYVANWVAVKVRWSLSMDERERVTVGNILQACARG